MNEIHIHFQLTIYIQINGIRDFASMIRQMCRCVVSGRFLEFQICDHAQLILHKKSPTPSHSTLSQAKSQLDRVATQYLAPLNTLMSPSRDQLSFTVVKSLNYGTMVLSKCAASFILDSNVLVYQSSGPLWPLWVDRRDLIAQPNEFSNNGKSISEKRTFGLLGDNFLGETNKMPQEVLGMNDKDRLVKLLKDYLKFISIILLK